MTEALLFLLGFSAMIGVVEVTKSGKTSRSDKLGKATEKICKK